MNRSSLSLKNCFALSKQTRPPLEINLPFYKEKIQYVYPSFSMGSLNLISIHIGDQDYIFDIVVSRFPKALNNYSSYRYVRESFHSNLKDYSWWNLVKNMKLVENLNYKASKHGFNVKSIELSDIKTPYLDGILIDSKLTYEDHTIEFIFELDDYTYAIAFIAVHPNKLIDIKNIIASIKPIEDIAKIYKSIEDKLKGNHVTNYPKELLLLSIISIKGPTEDNLKELIGILKAKKYESFIIESIYEERRKLE